MLLGFLAFLQRIEWMLPGAATSTSTDSIKEVRPHLLLKHLKTMCSVCFMQLNQEPFLFAKTLLISTIT